MSIFELSRPYAATLKALAAVLMTGTIAGCSSDLSRFSYNNALNDGQLTTASVKQPFENDLAPVGVGANAQSYPGDYRVPSTYQAQSTVQQYPGATRSPSPIYTASIPTSSANAPKDLYQAATPPKQVSVVREALAVPTKPTFADKVRSALARKEATKRTNVVQTPVVARAPVQNILPRTQDSIVTGSIQSVSQAKTLVPMKPDLIVTGSIPSKTESRKGGWSTIGGTKVSLSEGETVYNLSRRYGVPAAEILKANNVSDSRTLMTGQVLTIPVYAYSLVAPVSAPDNDVLTKSANSHRGSRTIFPHGSSAPVPDTRNGVVSVASQTAATAPVKKLRSEVSTYTVSSGDTLNRVAFKHGVSVSALQTANGLTNSNIRIGQKLNIPGKSFKNMAPDNTTTASTSTKQSDVRKIVATKKIVTENTDALTKTAKIEADIVAPKKTGIDKLRWPAKGQIVTSFGGKTEAGKRNDGIDILMPEGSAIKAAENGVVIYSDSGLKGFGNTVLVRHDDNLVTVYAHARSLNVKRGDKVTRGQVVAYSGMSGSAKRPKLHFEVRHKAVPKNPISYLE